VSPVLEVELDSAATGRVEGFPKERNHVEQQEVDARGRSDAEKDC